MSKQRVVIFVGLILFVISSYFIFILFNARSYRTIETDSSTSPTMSKQSVISDPPSGSKTQINTQNIEWIEYPVEIDGKTYFFRMQKGATIPPLQELKKLIKQ